MIYVIDCPELYGLFMGETCPFEESDIYTAVVILAQNHPNEEGIVDQFLKGLDSQAFDNMSLSLGAFRSYLLQGSLMLYEQLHQLQICPPYVNDLEFVSIRSPGRLLIRKLA